MGSLHACSILKYAQPRPIWATTSFGPEETQQVPKSMSVVNSRWPNSPKLKARKSILLGLTNMRNDNQHFLSIRPKISHEMLVVFITIQIITFWASSTLAFIRNCIQCVEQKRSSINEATYTSFVKVTHIMIQIAIAATNDHHGDFWLQKFKVISGCFCKSHI